MNGMDTHYIRFGTDGWRAVIGDQFTFDNVRLVAQALSDFLLDSGMLRTGVAVSWDTRFMSEHFAKTFAEVVCSNGIAVMLSEGFTPTPVLSHAVKHLGLDAGVMITASHNPYFYNGIKFKNSFGGPVMPDWTSAVQSNLGKNIPRINQKAISKKLRRVNFYDNYSQDIEKFIRWDAVQKAGKSIVFDAMHGCGSGIMRSILKDKIPAVHVIRNELNPLFGSKHPEPIPELMVELMDAVRAKSAFLGIATDGDADRFGIVDRNGEFVQLHDLMPLLFRYLIESRGWSGNAVRTTSMADTIDRMAFKMGRKVIEVPVGFKNIAEKMLADDILIGGEESGGIGYKYHLPERDGILSALLTLEMIGSYETDMAELIQGLRKEYGPFAYGRIDAYHDAGELQNNLTRILENPPHMVDGLEVAKVNMIDGIKIYFADNSWVLLRVSQTEPLARIYVVAKHPDMVNKILRAGKKLITGH